MKTILIVSLGMEIGGAERSLLTLLSELNYSKVKVDLFLLHKKGDLLKYIPEEVNVLKENQYYSQLAIPLKEVIKNKKYSIAYGRIQAKILAKIYDIFHRPKNESYVELEYSHKYTKRFMPQIADENYDLVISYLTPHYFAAEKAFGKKKVAWIHTDYEYIDCDVNSEKEMWDQYDKIVAISAAVKASFLKKFPMLEHKIIMVENTVSRKFIECQANEFDVLNQLDQHSVKLLSIGRFCHPKNFDSIPEICSLLIKQGYKVKWYIMGFGEDENLIKSRIEEYRMEKTVIILGKRINPYPYIKACDIYVQPSRYEGKAITVLEAQALNKPVIITNYGTASSQLKDGNNGIIVSLENQKCAEEIGKVIDNMKLQKKLTENCKRMQFPNDFSILYDLCEDKI
mgnify:CR=1 FL=1